MKIGVIGGSGIGKLKGLEAIEDLSIETPFGATSSLINKYKIGNAEFFCLPRHGDGHTISPSEINYRANIYALKSLGVKSIISISAVGSLREDLGPGTFFLPDQFIDWTKGIRKRTFFEDGIVGHISCALPINPFLSEEIWQTCNELNLKVKRGGSYICIEGPQFSSKAESAIYRNFGASVIGMTNIPEAYLANEASIAYATLAMVTDFDCWKETPCTVEEILKVMNINNENAMRVVQEIIPRLHELENFSVQNAESSIMSSRKNLTQRQTEILNVLLK